MSKFLQPPEPILTREGFIGSSLHYIMDELKSRADIIDTPWGNLEKNGEPNAQYLMNRSGQKMRLYGTAKELADNLKVFRNFPESHRHFEITDSIPYFTTPIIYKSLKEEDYVCKSDLFVILQNIVFHVFPEAHDPVLRPMLMIFIKSQEHRVLDRLEFVKYDPKVFDEIEKELIGEIQKNKTSIHTQHSTANNMRDVLSMFRKMIPSEFVNREESESWGMEVMANQKSDEISNTARLHKNVRIIVKSLQTIIDKRPEMFLPGKNPNAVRLFEDGDQKFVITHELDQVLMTSGEFKREYPKKDYVFYDTMSFDDMMKKKKKAIEEKGVEFIRTPILRAKHKAVPIRAPDGDFCILSSDVTLELVRFLIHGLKLFQKIKKAKWPTVRALFQQIEPMIKPDTKCIYFLNLGYYDNLEKLFAVGTMSVAYTPGKEVRNVKKDGFSVQDLKDELRYLGISDLFEEIGGYTQVVYEEIDENKKETVLRTCDLMDALEKCQVYCLVNRVTYLKKFFHNQKSCKKVEPFECSLCPKKPAVPAEKSPDSDDVKDSKRAPEGVKPPGSMESSKTPKSSELAPKAPEDVMTSEFAKLASGDAKSTTSSKDTKTSDKKDAKSSTTEPPQSKNCEKCFRTCETLNEAKKELKASENKVKKLEKKVEEKAKELVEVKKMNMEEEKKEVEEKEKEIQELKRKLAENSRIASENEAFQLKIQQLESTNSELKDNISSQENAFLTTQAALNEHISQLEIDLADEKEKYQHPRFSDDEKSRFELEIQEKNRQIHEFHEKNIGLKAENEFKERMIQQLMDKLASSSSSFK